MAKDSRIVVRMSNELREWLDVESKKMELDSAAWVRMQLTGMKNGAPTLATPPCAPEQPGAWHERADDPSIDIDAMVDETMATAGLDAETLALHPIDRVAPAAGQRISMPRGKNGDNLLVRR